MRSGHVSERVRRFRPGRSSWRQVALRALEEINSPRSLSIWMLLSYGEDHQVAALEVNPLSYNHFDDFRRDYLATELLRKFPGLGGTSRDQRKQSALEKALAAERHCSNTNRRIAEFQYGGAEIFPGAEALILRARRKIAFVLGRYSLDSHLNFVRWGPGADTLNKRPYITPYHKYKGALSAPRSCVPYLSALLERNELWASWLGGHPPSGSFFPLVELSSSNRYTTVPKTALTDRSICIEPGVAIYLQLGLGQMIRRRLRRVGIDLNSQEKNQRLALSSSKDEKYATLDLSSASDTVARRLVQLLLVDEDHPDLGVWYRVLDDLRCKFTQFRKDEKWLNAKFSSMGNGYTFELETLLFWALSSAAAEEVGGECAAVYGDDIIVSKHAYQRVREVLEGCGFLVNPRKSFHSGYFRESCGTNAWNGVKIQPYRLVEWTSVKDVYSFHNGLRRLGLSRAANVALKLIPEEIRFFGPANERDDEWNSLGDIVLEHPDIHHWKMKPHGLVDQWFFWGMRVRCLHFEPRKVRVKAYEPAILHSFATMVPLSDHPVYDGCRWGTTGLATLSRGCWNVGEAVITRKSSHWSWAT